MNKSIFSYFIVLYAVISLMLVACNGSANKATDKSGPEYTAHWICPMHCKGSGSEQKGDCPTCGMAYVLNPEHEH